MQIQQMFKDDINRKIDGVVKVQTDNLAVLQQEVHEYVITRELRKHFIHFFDSYSEAFTQPTANIGVWISGFFGSGKSHFLKMLSYLLDNKTIGEEKVVDCFRRKFADDVVFDKIANAITPNTHTILFNIDLVGSSNKDKTAVLKVFTRMFYEYLGFYGKNLKVAKLEQYIQSQGKTEQFRQVFAQKYGEAWIDVRHRFAFLEDAVVPTLMEVLGMSQNAAENYFNSSDEIDISIQTLVEEIKAYVDSQPDDFRLLFMADEVGQYIGADTNYLLNLQTIVEAIGSKCQGKVWIVCTGQEAIDEVIKARENEFSRIQARFPIRLSLSSSSADEVIQKRILAKTSTASERLTAVYDKNEAVLRNLFTFTNAIADIKGYKDSESFVNNFPFIPYQFITMQKVFVEIRKHGNTGKHLSGGERSMLSGFQEAVQAIQMKDEYSLAPFYLFYNTVHVFLDSSIRRVIERCQNAADNDDIIQQQDVDVLKLLYLIRYINDIPAVLDNIVILMADNINIDKISMRERIAASLNRLLKQNYIGRTGDVYNFLTDEEQDIQREIKHTDVDTSLIISRIGEIIFTDIYETKKFTYGKKEFAFNKYVDNTASGIVVNNELTLKILTVAADETEKNKLNLLTQSQDKAIVVLDEKADYYEPIEQELKIDKYVKQLNQEQLPLPVQHIIQNHMAQAHKFVNLAKEELTKAILRADFYIAGEQRNIKGSTVKAKLDEALSYLTQNVYHKFNLIKQNFDSEEQINQILQTISLDGKEVNSEAINDVEMYLAMQAKQKLPTSMNDIVKRYQARPYGWRELDIVAAVASLIAKQKVTVKYVGNFIDSNDSKLISMLRRKSEIGRTIIAKREIVSAVKLRQVKEILSDYFNETIFDKDENSLIATIKTKFADQIQKYNNFLHYYETNKYPDELTIKDAIRLLNHIFTQRTDHIALVNTIINSEEELFDMQENMQNIENFFATQRPIFDRAVKLLATLKNDENYFKQSSDIDIQSAEKAINLIRKYTIVDVKKYDYKAIPQLNNLMNVVHIAHEKILKARRAELDDFIMQCLQAIHQAGAGVPTAKGIIKDADDFFGDKRIALEQEQNINALDGLQIQFGYTKDRYVEDIEYKRNPPQPKVKPKENEATKTQPATPKKAPKIKNIYRQVIFPARILSSDAQIDAYVESIREQLKENLKDNDSIKLV